MCNKYVSHSFKGDTKEDFEIEKNIVYKIWIVSKKFQIYKLGNKIGSKQKE